MNLEQKFAKCLYIAYKKDIKLYITSFYLDGNDDLFKRELDNTFWSELKDDAECLECIEDDPSSACDFNFKNIDSFMGYTIGTDQFTLCKKIFSDLPEFKEDEMNTFIKEYGTNL